MTEDEDCAEATPTERVLMTKLDSLEKGYLEPINKNVNAIKDSLLALKILGWVVAPSIFGIALGYWLTLLGILPL